MRHSIYQAAFLCFLSVPVAMAWSLINPMPPVQSVDQAVQGEVILQEALDWGDRVIWLDARPAEEYEAQHIPGALPLNEQDWNRLLDAVLDLWEPGHPIVVYCSSASCGASGEVADRLRNEVGLDEVYVLKGGWQAWLKQDGGRP